MKFTPNRISIKHPKRLVIIIVSTVVGLSLIAYGYLSYNAWQNAISYGKEGVSYLKSSLDNSLGASNPSGTPSDQIKKVIADFEKRYGADICRVNELYNWQTFIPAVKDIQTSCEAALSKTTSVIEPLKTLLVFYEDRNKATTLLSDTLEKTKEPTKDMPAAIKTWSALHSAVLALNLHPPFDVVGSTIQTLSAQMNNALTRLQSASTSENKTLFDEATADIAENYTLIDEIRTLANEKQQGLIDQFTKAYEKL